VTLALTVDPDGRARDLSVRGGGERLDACVAAAMAGLRFPAVPGGSAVRVIYPYRLVPEPEQREPAPEPLPPELRP
jgi:hypothetical protein